MKQIILFDGACNVCDKSVQFILSNDPKANFAFASQQSTIGKELMAQYSVRDVNSLILLDGLTYYTKSTAVLMICRKLKFPWNLASFFQLIPTSIRDSMYEVIAKNRYRFGRKETCMLLTPDERKRFLD
ncbi:thiol-disulfide oxidoreductase DCC family protein [Halalkalibacter okhensis]|uniref:Thiol-disulfide oxidoreductase n=1 Tax=Halalkalibacter okhensis TaxID=333138 RepID=A0A0B0IK24_9BACI|nr:DCC1-like thiol-disulfide oxidoreductase family protein [Halalkalibacter okhensis]KHF40026.1 thiol-disulfide oxidoreductase [Halalkalibacter okhensis]